MDRAVFFASVRRSNFEGRLKQGQVEGLSRILDYRATAWPKMIDEELAYVLATAQWESSHSLQPIEEGYPLIGDRLRAYQKKLKYWPWFGRGLPQLTHETNYIKFGIRNPDDMLKWDESLRVLFEGMVLGRFRNAKLADYITAEAQDYVHARNIVNGRRKGEELPDRAREIAALAVDYLKALRAASASPLTQPLAVDTRAAQERLVALCYHLGSPDGVLGEATVGAIASFQFTNALPITGQLDPATVELLMSDRASPSEVADARERDDMEDIQGSKTVDGAQKAQQGGYGLVGLVATALMAHPKGAGVLLLGGAAVWCIARVAQGVTEVKQARLEDHRTGANLGR